jgi:hypothetical protein
MQINEMVWGTFLVCVVVVSGEILYKKAQQKVVLKIKSGPVSEQRQQIKKIKCKCRRFLFLVFAGRTGQGGEEGGGEKGRGSRGRDRVHGAPTIGDSLICNGKHNFMPL